MEDGEKIQGLLQEIRDTLREHLAEYRQAAQRSLELQERAVARQEQMGRLYRRILFLGGLIVAVLLALLIHLFARWWERIM